MTIYSSFSQKHSYRTLHIWTFFRRDHFCSSCKMFTINFFFFFIEFMKINYVRFSSCVSDLHTLSSILTIFVFIFWQRSNAYAHTHTQTHISVHIVSSVSNCLLTKSTQYICNRYDLIRFASFCLIEINRSNCHTWHVDRSHIKNRKKKENTHSKFWTYWVNNDNQCPKTISVALFIF